VETKDKTKECGRLALEKKAKEVVALDLSGLTDIADSFVIASGASERHVRTISDGVEQGMKEKEIRPMAIEGYDEGRWVIMDYGDVIVHVFLEELRELYDLESLWIEAKRQVMEQTEI
jgi:ribosome-associated protein